MNEKERISMTSEICGEICKPIVIELNTRDEKLKIELERTAEKVKRELDRTQTSLHVKLDGIYLCLASKIPSRLFWRVIGAFFTLVFGICGLAIAGSLWSIYGKVLEVSTKVDVMAVTVTDTRENLKFHLVQYDIKGRIIDNRLNKIETGETYYRYHDKTEQQKRMNNIMDQK